MEVEVLGDEVGESRDGDVEVFVPDGFLSQYTFYDAACIACGPEIGEELKDFGGIIRLNRCTVGACAASVVEDDGSKSEDETLGESASTLEVGLESRKVACLVFGEGVEHDARNLMVNEWVIETLKDIGRELLKFVDGEVEGLHEFIELDLVDVASYNRVVAGVANDVNAAKVGHGREDSVGTVEEGDLTFMVGFLAWCDEDVESCLLGRELGAEGVDVHVVGFLDDPEVEGFALYDEVVGIGDALLNVSNFLTWEAGNDTIDEGGADVAVVGEPLEEVRIVVGKVGLPEFYVLKDALFEFMAIEEDEFAGHDDESLGGVGIEGLEAMVEELCEFARIGGTWCVGEAASGIKGDACLSGVGDDEAYLGLLGEGHVSLELGVGVEGSADDINALESVDGLSVETSLEVDVVEAILAVEPIDHTALDGLYDDDAGVEVGALVHVADDPINEATEEVAFAKLDDAFGCVALGSRARIKRFHGSFEF